jgi:N-carbamoyl-L-amino-acid hydrolase
MQCVNGGRLWQSLMSMAEIGPGEHGGSRRLALTDEDKLGRDQFVDWCKALGCTIDVDQMGNIFARRAGRNEALAPICMGSHLDTQPHGGKFDGVYGVLAGLEVLRTLADAGLETEAPVEVIVWTNEEGSRFAPAMVSSAVFAGVFDLDYGLSRADRDGITIGEELDRIGYAGTTACGGRALGAFFEAHIEQGPILERELVTIGVVRGGQGSRWYDLSLRGQDAHAGSTPMTGRRDALVGAARIIDAIQALALTYAPDAVSTVGQLEVLPNSRNTIPGEVRFSVDLRHFDAGVLSAMSDDLRRLSEQCAETEGLTLDFEEIWYQPPVQFDEQCIDAVADAARSLGLSNRAIFSGAGHDACLISKVAPTAMIFVPCAGGISHNEEESATPEDLAAGCDVLLHAVLAMANRA